MRLTIIFLSFLLLTGCSIKDKRPTTYSEMAMGTVAEISLWEDNGVSDLGFNEIKRIEDKFSIFKPDSEISRNEFSDEGKYLIQESERYKRITDGAFDISYRQNKPLTLTLSDPRPAWVPRGRGMGEGRYDLGGIAKGYAVDRVAQIFKEKNVKSAMINLGGNLYLIGYPPGKNFWTVGIKDPGDPERLIGRLRLDKELGIATSGNYERPGHIIDPKTGKSVTHSLSVTIVAPTALEADALSTGVFVLGREKGAELIEKLPDVEGVIINKDGIWISSGLKDKYENLH